MGIYNKNVRKQGSNCSINGYMCDIFNTIVLCTLLLLIALEKTVKITNYSVL